MRRHDKLKKIEESNSSKLPEIDCRLSSHSSSEKITELSRPIKFLNSISHAQAKALIKKAFSTRRFQSFVNPKHVDDEITLEELDTFTSVTPEDGKHLYEYLFVVNNLLLIGKFFKKWISCKVLVTSLQTSVNMYSAIDLSVNDETYECVRSELKQFCSERSIRRIIILSYVIYYQSLFLPVGLQREGEVVRDNLLLKV
jgi:hypothetical protein